MKKLCKEIVRKVALLLWLWCYASATPCPVLSPGMPYQVKEKEREKQREIEREKKARLMALKSDNIAEYRKHIQVPMPIAEWVRVAVVLMSRMAVCTTASPVVLVTQRMVLPGLEERAYERGGSQDGSDHD
eukprot:2859165-Rhodomonas_salina.8